LEKAYLPGEEKKREMQSKREVEGKLDKCKIYRNCENERKRVQLGYSLATSGR
jgi:hypothetical protein